MRGRSGSILLVALVTVATATLLALALAAWTKAQAQALAGLRYRAEVRRGCHSAALQAVAELLLEEGGAGEGDQQRGWQEPWERREAGWVWRVSGQGWSSEPGATVGLQDEGGKVPLHEVPAALLTALLLACCELEGEVAQEYAARIVDWIDSDDEAVTGGSERERYGRPGQTWQAPNRPLAALEELYAIPGIAPEILATVMPCLTIYGGQQININAATVPVLTALLELGAAGDMGSALRLLERILAFRRAGASFSTATAQLMARELGGLPMDEAALLGRLEPFMTVETHHLSGVAEATPAAAWQSGRKGGRAAFVWSLKEKRFLRWVDE